jgi:uncharacterized protein (DUF2336 family)
MDEIETSLRGASSERRSDTLRRITSLFLSGADDFNDQQVAVFDDVLCELIKKIERQAIIELSNSVAPIVRTPAGLTRKLSRHDDIEIAGPVLRQSPLLSDRDLIEIAQSKSQSHLVAIAGRRTVSENVSDVLVDRGNSEVLTTVAGNIGARFSSNGYGVLLGKAEKDAEVAAAVLTRSDLSPDMFRKLVARASETVQKRLMTIAQPAVRDRLRSVLQDVSLQILRDAASTKTETRGSPQLESVDKSKLRGELSDHAAAGRMPETVIALAALSGLSGDIIRRLISQRETDALLIVCKASQLGWRPARAVIDLAAKGDPAWNSAKYLDEYTKLTAEAAQRVIRFLNARKAVSGAELKKVLAAAPAQSA